MRSIQLIISILALAYATVQLNAQTTNDSVRVTYKGRGVTVRPQGDESKTTIQFKDTLTKKEIQVKVSFREMDEEDDLDSSIQKTIRIISDMSKDDKRKHFIETHFLPNFDWGFTSTDNEKDNDYAVTPRFAKSANLNWGIIKQDMNLYRNRFLFSYGFSLNNYYLKYNDRQKVQYLDNAGHLATYQDTVTTYTTNRLDVFYLSVPLMFEYRTKGNKFRIMAGIEYNFGGRSKVVTKGVAESQDFKHKDDTNLKISPTQVNAILRVGSEHVALYGRYSLTDMYQSSAYAGDTNPHQHMFSVGISLIGM